MDLTIAATKQPTLSLSLLASTIKFIQIPKIETLQYQQQSPFHILPEQPTLEQTSQPYNALDIYAYLRRVDHEVDNFMVTVVLKACSFVSMTQMGKEIHGFAVMNGLIEDVFVKLKHTETGKTMYAYVTRNLEKMGVHLTTACVDMYAKSGNLASARLLFNGLNQKSNVSWTAMIAGYIHCNKLEEGVKLFARMIEERIKPNEITLLSLVVECGFVGALELGKQLHAYILRNRICVSWLLLLLWLISYPQAHCIDQAFDLFVKMRDNGVRPNQVTMATMLSFVQRLEPLTWANGFILA
ncbi:hypothetical protein CRYUN_Cryun08bG0030200 [Craigia yunnanensis]